MIQRLWHAMVPSQALRWRIRRAVERLNTRFAPRPPLDSATRYRLQALFESDVRILSEMIG